MVMMRNLDWRVLNDTSTKDTDYEDDEENQVVDSKDKVMSSW